MMTHSHADDFGLYMYFLFHHPVLIWQLSVCTHIYSSVVAMSLALIHTVTNKYQYLCIV